MSSPVWVLALFLAEAELGQFSQLHSQKTALGLGVQTEAFPRFRTTFNQKQNPGGSLWGFSVWSGSANKLYGQF